MLSGIKGLTLKEFEERDIKDFGLHRTLRMSNAEMFKDEETGQMFAQYSFEDVPIGEELVQRYQLLLYVEKQGDDWVIIHNWSVEGPFSRYLQTWKKWIKEWDK